jgi:hypothetical protein
MSIFNGKVQRSEPASVVRKEAVFRKVENGFNDVDATFLDGNMKRLSWHRQNRVRR